LLASRARRSECSSDRAGSCLGSSSPSSCCWYSNWIHRLGRSPGHDVQRAVVGDPEQPGAERVAAERVELVKGGAWDGAGVRARGTRRSVADARGRLPTWPGRASASPPLRTCGGAHRDSRDCARHRAALDRDLSRRQAEHGWWLARVFRIHRRVRKSTRQVEGKESGWPRMSETWLGTA
jgi:hypothetical protein